MTSENFPRITLVTPVYNGADLVARNIASVADSRYPNLEHILVDNKSRDRSWEIMNALAARHPHLRVARQEETQGAAATINHGFSLATGDIYAWLGHDDQWFPETPWRVRDHWLRHPETDFLAGTVRILEADGKIEKDRKPLTHLDFINLFVGSHIINQEGCFWRREIHSPLDQQIRAAFDYDLWLRLFFREPFYYFMTDELLAHFQRRIGQISDNVKNYTEEMNLCRALHCSRVLNQPREKFMHFHEQLQAMRQVASFRKRYDQKIIREEVIFTPQVRADLVFFGIFYIAARPHAELVFHGYDFKARSIALLENNKPRAVAKIRTRQARLSVKVPSSGLAEIDLTSHGLDSPTDCWIKCTHIICDGKTILRATGSPSLPHSIPDIRLEFSSPKFD